MSILIDSNSRVLVQGITGKNGAFHTSQMLSYGTRIIGGVTPGKGGQAFQDNIPIFNSVAEAVRAVEPNVSVIFVPAPFAKDAICEAAAAKIDLIIAITENIPVLDMMYAARYVKEQGSRLIGPNCPGAITPGVSKVGIMPGMIHKPGRIGIISRSGTLTYEAVDQLSNKGLGQSTAVGIGGDPIVGTSFIDLLQMFEEDPDTDATVLIGEIGGDDEEQAALYIADHIKKPVIAFIAGQTAPKGKRMGHAGAIVSGGKGTAESKIKALQKAGVYIAEKPTDIGSMVQQALSS